MIQNKTQKINELTQTEQAEHIYKRLPWLIEASDFSRARDYSRSRREDQ